MSRAEASPINRNNLRVVRVFVSSPYDVAAERGRARAVAAKLNAQYAGIVAFETVLWEERFYTADKSFQPQIDDPAKCDIVVSIFWTRIGTEPPADFPRMRDGRPYPSGTGYELLTALEHSKQEGVPDVYVFRKTADARIPVADPARRLEAEKQLDALEAFWREWFRADTGQFKTAFQNFTNTDEFEQQLELLLRQWLETRGVLQRNLVWPKEKGSPFRGLAPFEAAHADVFFGRDRVIDDARRRLTIAAERGTPFLQIVGAPMRRADPRFGSPTMRFLRAGPVQGTRRKRAATSIACGAKSRMRKRAGRTTGAQRTASCRLAFRLPKRRSWFQTLVRNCHHRSQAMSAPRANARDCGSISSPRR